MFFGFGVVGGLGVLGWVLAGRWVFWFAVFAFGCCIVVGLDFCMRVLLSWGWCNTVFCGLVGLVGGFLGFGDLVLGFGCFRCLWCGVFRF